MRVGMRAFLAGLMALTLLGAGGCKKPTPAQFSTQEGWGIKVSGEGLAADLPIQVFNIFLTDNEGYPENFEFEGEGLTLAGAFPSEVRVGYGEKLEVLLGKTIPILPRGGDPVGERDSALTLSDGRVLSVTGGAFRVDTLAGTKAGMEGDRTVRGVITLMVDDQGTTRTLTGTFAAHAVTWG